MASVVTSAMDAAAQQLPLHTIISGIFGSISMAAWICVILPQMVVNYRNKSAEALSVPFLIVWMLGDATNLIGGLLTHLAPTAVILATYFCITNVFLVAQTLYYNSLNARRAAESTEPSEHSPLLTQSAARRRDDEAISKLDELDPEQPRTTALYYNALSLLAIYAAGILGWFISYKAGAWDTPTPEPVPLEAPDAELLLSERIGMFFGYISAACYVFARIPQIIKNYKEKSCDGLAILFFMLSLTGNLTYAISIITFSQDSKYLSNIIPWLIGSLGTVSEDFIIFLQFQIYSNNRRGRAAAAS
ncbi:putative vacuolar amino acid transporter [Escovopsis weberi]|uniref:Putative vacuolar amino acid transporter n=1 Tax=Escovopsis weberi TaxID=150374 RepID=A0A0M9VUI2_ESCWE|nr:putative vacuolar amino acid transporter [Escovopsis weberi]